MRFKDQIAYETDKRSGVRPETVHKLAKGLFVPPEELLKEDDE